MDDIFGFGGSGLRGSGNRTLSAQQFQQTVATPSPEETGASPHDVMLPIDWDAYDKKEAAGRAKRESQAAKAEAAERKQAVITHFGWQPGGPDLSKMGFSGGIRQLASSPSPHSPSNEPTQDVVSTLGGSDMPIADIRKAGVKVEAADSGSTFSSLGGGEAGFYDPMTNRITYLAKEHGRAYPIEERRDVLVHEAAHSLQWADMPHSTRQQLAHLVSETTANKKIDEESQVIDLLPSTADRAAEKHPERAADIFSRRDEMLAKSARTIKTFKTMQARYGLETKGSMDPTKEADLLSMTPYEAISEGSAVGYAGRFSGVGRVQPHGYGTGERYGEHAPLFRLAQEFSLRTGTVIPVDTVHAWSKLAGVLKEDLVDGQRSSAVDEATTARIAAHMLRSPRSQGFRRNRGVGREIEQRAKAFDETLNYGQMSLFPDISPDLDAFGRPAEAPELSPRGEAVRAGDPTLPDPEQTIFGRATQQVELQDQRARERRVPGHPRYPYRDDRTSLQRKLDAHVADLQERRSKQQETTQLAESQAVHPDVDAWLGKLVHKEKKQHALDYYHWVVGGRQGEMPTPPSRLQEEHAAKGRAGIDKILGKLGLG